MRTLFLLVMLHIVKQINSAHQSNYGQFRLLVYQYIVVWQVCDQTMSRLYVEQ